MFCARCGQQIPDASEICPLCGREAALKVDPQQVAPASAPAAAPGQIRWPDEPTVIGPPMRRAALRGVGGWLLVFCILLTLVNPAVVVVLVWTGAYRDDFIIIYIAWAAFGVLTGALLWSVHRHVFVFLWIYFGITVLILLLAIAGMALSDESVNPSQVTVTFRGLIYTCAWFYYFKKSDRVQATFGRNM